MTSRLAPPVNTPPLLSSLRIGIDVGGTNTDAVLMAGNHVLASSKQATTADVSAGVIAAIEAVLKDSPNSRSAVRAVMVGTTHFVNAVVQRRSLFPVASLRIGLPMGSAIPPMVDWPDDLRAAVDCGAFLLRGGCYYTGVDYAELDEAGIRDAARALRSKGPCAVAIASVFSPIRPDIEVKAGEIVRAELPHAVITLSHQLGGLGLIERENSAIINASLTTLADSVVSGLEAAIAACGLCAELYISHNDGTLMDGLQVRRFPVFACAAGPTNSIRGAAYLTGLQEAVVVDVGGTTTDVGMLVKGLARETSAAVDLGGVKTNFAMPDVLSVALGGGTIVAATEDEPCGLTSVSVGYRLQEEARVFGGTTLTATDIAVANGWMNVGDPARIASIDTLSAGRISREIASRIASAVDQVKLSAADCPVVAVGGGAALVRDDLPGASAVIRPDHGGVANAIGAAIAQVGGRVKRLFDYRALGGREAAIAQATQEAELAAIGAGATRDSLRVVEIEEFPMPYMENSAVDLRVRVVGDLAFDAAGEAE